ncbi:MAG: MBL fold metallo-hydrolase [Candidatus Thermoplasmatota archaeon]
MEVNITYIYHSCFSIQLQDKVFLFDYPGAEVGANAEKKLRSQIRGRDLFVFVSHAHGDHFSPEVTDFSSGAESARFILSKDVPSRRFSLQSDYKVREVKPGRSYSIDDVVVKTFESNDAGVAFLLRTEGATIYYGGDLAKWNWPEWSERKREEHVKVFDEVVRSLKDEDIDIAFSNMDERLPSWAGPVEFMEKVKPAYFVPMHTFGSEEWIDDLVEKGWGSDTELFHYSSPGDEVSWNI